MQAGEYIQSIENAIDGGGVDIGYENGMHAARRAGDATLIGVDGDHIGVSVPQFAAMVDADARLWEPFAAMWGAEGYVGYVEAAKAAGCSVVTLKRAVSRGAVRQFGRHRPARLDPVSVVRWRHASKAPSRAREREQVLLWRLLLSDRPPRSWAATTDPNRWNTLDALLPCVALPVAPALVQMLADYSAHEIALVSALVVVEKQKSIRQHNGKQGDSLLPWIESVAVRHGVSLKDVYGWITPTPWACTKCQVRAQHVGKVGTEFTRRGNPREYALRCPRCGKEWTCRLEYDEFKGPALDRFRALNGQLPRHVRVSVTTYRKYMRRWLRDWKRREGGATAISRADIARLCGVSRAAVSTAVKRAQGNNHAVPFDRACRVASRVWKVCYFLGPHRRHVMPSIFERAAEHVLAAENG